MATAVEDLGGALRGGRQQRLFAGRPRFPAGLVNVWRDQLRGNRRGRRDVCLEQVVR